MPAANQNLNLELEKIIFYRRIKDDKIDVYVVPAAASNLLLSDDRGN
jgi:hypothetical protein